MITTLANPYNASTNTGYGCIEFDSESKQVTNSVQRAVLQGAIKINGYAYKDSFDTLREYFGAQLQISLLGYYIRFADSNVLQILLNNGIGDGVGLTQENIEAVTTLNSYFRENTNIVTFDELNQFINVTSIGYWGFAKCIKLTSIDLSNIQTTAERAFSGCSSLNNICDLSNIVTLGGGTFENCISLTNIGDMPLLETTFWGAFRSCSSLESVGDMPKLTGLGQEMFRGCSSLVSVGAMSNVTSISNTCFRDCISLVNVGDLSNVITISDEGFLNCNSLVSVNLKNVKTIGNTFNRCYALKVLVMFQMLLIWVCMPLMNVVHL